MAIGSRQRVKTTGSPLTWLSSILWSDGQAWLTPGNDGASVEAGGHGELNVGLHWWASPTAEGAEILIPGSSIEAAKTAVRRYHDGFTLRRRTKSWAAESIMRIPGLAPRLLGRHAVVVEGRPSDGLLSHLAQTLANSNQDLNQLHVAVSLARPKSNRKPVLQLIDQNGRCVGWAKVGWNDWTAQLLDNEAHWLQARPEHPLTIPRLLEHTTINDHRVVVTSGAVPSRWPRRRANHLDPALLSAIADLGTRTRAPILESPWWASVEEVLPVATASETRAIEQVAASAQSLVFDLGAWHGDLTPWNVMTVSSGSSGSGRWPRSTGTVHQVIDWEFAADGVPLGFDLCHYHTQVASEMKGLSVVAALDESARLSPQGLAELGIDPHNQIAVYRLYLVELIRRTLALRAAGMPVDEVKQGAAAVRRVRADLLSPGPAPEDRAHPRQATELHQ